MIIKERYKDTMKRMTKLVYPDLPSNALDRALEWSINDRYKPESARLTNNYTNEEASIQLDELTEYILKREPIVTPYGVMFKKYNTEPVPLLKMIKSFMDLRGIHKSDMFKFPKGSDQFDYYNLLQLLDKIDANGSYGAMSQNSCLFYNVNVAASITAQGRALISTATMFFESFLSNGVKFASLEEVIQFIDCVCQERPNRRYADNEILDAHIDVQTCFAKIVLSIGDFRHGKVKWYPTMDDLDVIWTMLNRLDQEDINRLYYKNNLYEFLNNKSMGNAMIYILKQLKEPYLDPNHVPDEIKIELEAYTDILREYVMYKHHWIDVVDRCDNMIKNVALLSDTDSAIVCLETWYQYNLEKIKGIDLPILNQEVDEFKYVNGDKDYVEEIQYEKVLDFDFYSNEIIEVEKAVNQGTIIPQENLRYSIINIAGYFLYTLANEYIEDYTHRNFSYTPERKCLLYLKNEFLFKVALLTNNKKNYATKQEVQEGNMVPEEESLDIKGLAIKKSTINEKARKELERILYDEILNTDKIDQVNIIKQLAILEKQIFQSLQSGNKEYYKPAAIKSKSNYDDPMGIQGIKASVIWNMVRGEGLPAIDLDARNRIDIVKVEITRETAEKIKDKFPETYGNIIHTIEWLETTELERAIERAKKRKELFEENGDYKSAEKVKIPTTIPAITITALAIPVDCTTPDWVLEFIDYKTIINDCLCNFPIESVGIYRPNDKVNYTNIVSI